MEGIIKRSMRFGANMPMLSRHGFIDLGTVEFLQDPEVGFAYLGEQLNSMRFGVSWDLYLEVCCQLAQLEMGD